jgi:GntR family transcriptional regulator
MDAINRTSAEPYYQQLGHILEQRIRSKELSPGQRLPSESDLCRTFDLSRSTVRETLRSLQEQGLIRMIPRRGAFVAEQSSGDWMLQVTRGFFETEVDGTRTVDTTVFRSGLEPLPREASDALGLEPGAAGFILERLRCLDGKPAVYSTNFMPPEVGAVLAGTDVLRGTQSLNQTLRAAGYQISSARREVAAVGAPELPARFLGLDVRDPVLLIRSLSRGADGRPFDYYRSYARSDVVTIAVEAQAMDGD